MKRSAPIAVLLLFVLVAIYVGFRALSTQPPANPHGKTSASAPTPPPPSSSCTLLGRVVDSRGAPVPGESVEVVPLAAGDSKESCSTVTDARGRFRLGISPPRGRWQVRDLPSLGLRPAEPQIVHPVPGGSVRVVLRVAAPKEPPDVRPNVTGQVSDHIGCVRAGVAVVATSSGTVVARAETGEDGRFRMRVDAHAPVVVKVVGTKDEEGVRIPSLPSMGLHLVLPDTRGEGHLLLVYPSIDADVPRRRARLLVYNVAGEAVSHTRFETDGKAIRVPNLPYGKYDIRVLADGLAGETRGFIFDADHEAAVVPFQKAADLTARTTLAARAFLVSTSSTFLPVSETMRELDGTDGYVRGAVMISRHEKSFHLSPLPEGRYLLRFVGRGVETKEMTVHVTAGEKKDLGTVKLTRATASLSLRVTDQKKEPDRLAFRYLVQIYTVGGLSMRATLGPGEERIAHFDGLPAGKYYYRTSRMLNGMGHLRSVGEDCPIEIASGDKRSVDVDCTWRY